jgi:hypothetical protein
MIYMFIVELYVIANNKTYSVLHISAVTVILSHLQRLVLNSACQSPSIFADCNHFWISGQVFVKFLSIKFHGKPLVGTALMHAVRRVDGRT